MTPSVLVFAVVGLKGGIGKSLVAREIASTLHGARHRVLLVDADAPQETCRRWARAAAEAKRDGPSVVSVDGPSLRRYLDGCATSYDVVVVDTARLETEALAVLMVADLVLLPVIPGKEGLDGLDQTLLVVEKARPLRPELRVGAVLNLMSRTKLASFTRQAVEDRKLPVLGELADRTSRREAMALGLGSMAHAPGSKAADEVEALVRGALEAVGGKGSKRWQRAARKAS
jgi:cellulose biosynthesis protein BcsQ